MSLNGNIEESVDLEINETNNYEEDLITAYENIEEQSDLSDEDNEFGQVLESNFNLRKSNKGLDHISTENKYIRDIESRGHFQTLGSISVGLSFYYSVCMFFT